MKRYLLLGVVVAALLAFPGVANAQSGHFVQTQTCADIGTQVQCSGKVAGLGGTTFEITVAAQGTATVVCINPGGNRAPGQDTSVTVSGSSGPLPTPRNGQFRYTVTSAAPGPLPPTPTCPNAQWTPVITDVTFTTATITLTEDGVISDQVTVPVS
jgi:hypothetical protein